MIKYSGQLKNKKPNTIKRTKKGKSIYMCTDILTFDIETSNLYRDKSGRIFRYEKGKSAEYWNELEKFAIPYIWQFSYNDTVYYETEQSLELYSVKEGKKRSLYFQGELIDFKVNPQDEIMLLSEKDSLNYLYIYNRNGIRSFYQESYNDISNLRVYNNDTFYFKLDKEIYILRRKMFS